MNKHTNGYTKEEIQIIRLHYPKIGAVGVHKMIPNHSKNSIKIKAFELGVSKFKRFTLEEDNILRKKYPVYGAKHLSELLKRDLKSIQNRASALGLKKQPSYYAGGCQ